ncbi:porin [bacterium]|nr:porin [bacterium]
MTARCLSIVAATLFWVAPDAGFAQDTANLQQENAQLRARLDRLESVVDRLQPDLSSEAAKYSAVTPIPSEADQAGSQQVSNWAMSQLSAPDAPKFPTAKLTGFFQADAGWFAQDSANQAAVGNIQDGADFRRARLAATGKVAENVSYMLEMDFAFPGHPSFMDVWGEVSDVPILQNVRVGQYRNPFGMDGLTSVKELTFIERGLPFAFLPFRQIGAMAHGMSEAGDMTWAVSGFRYPTGQYGGSVGDNGGYGMASRLTGLIVDDGDSVVHIGGAYSFIDPANNMVQYRNQPEFTVSETGGSATPVPNTVPFFVNTGPIATHNVNLFAGELAATSGSWHAQGEVIYALVNRIAGSTVGFSGMSVQSAYILTGEHRPYNRENAVLGRVVPHQDFRSGCGWGAWEVAARWSYLNLNDGGITGGQLNDVTAGLNWYLNRYTKLQFNYIHAFLRTAGIGNSDADIVAMRAQVDF